jgi:hypothetical protein
MSVNVAPSERAMGGSDTATMFESSMISEDTSEVVSKSPRRAPVLLVSTIEEATITDGRAPTYPVPWWALLVGAPRVQPQKHCAHYPEKRDRRVSRGGRDITKRCGV